MKKTKIILFLTLMFGFNVNVLAQQNFEEEQKRENLYNPHGKPYSLNGVRQNAPNDPGMYKVKRDEEFDKKQASDAKANRARAEISSSHIEGSKVFGEWIFNGNFAQENIQGFNENYKISISDRIIIKIWGAIDQELRLVVDKQGNIFVPEVGPIKIVGVENSRLNDVIGKEIAKIFKNVKSYVTLDNEQPVKVYVSGFARKPGLYAGLSSDSLLYYIDKAGGIDPQRGSFLQVNVLRGNKVKNTFNLYSFLLDGNIEPIQFSDGDIIQILPRKNKVNVEGNVRNAFEFEFNKKISLDKIIEYAQPETGVNKVFITKKNNNDIVTLSYDLNDKLDIKNIFVENDDTVSLTLDKKLNTVSIRVEGEHDSEKDIVLPIGSTVQDLVDQLKKNNRTDLDSLQLFRMSVKEKQKESILESIRLLENNLLSTSSSTKNAAELREKEANMMLKLIESAKKVEPKGQVILERKEDFSKIYLENGDLIKIAGKSGLVGINGQVLQPTALVWQDNLDLEDYIERAGGYLSNANKDKILVRKASGAIRMQESGWVSGNVVIAKGDEIMVLPKVDMKNTQWIKDITELIYQVAVGAAVVLKF